MGRVWYPNIQFTFRYVDQAAGIKVWKSTTVTNFVTAPSDNLDKRSSKSDQFTITVDPATPNKYTIVGQYDDEVAISIVYERLAEGWKLGAGPRGGMSYFGSLAEEKVPPGTTPDSASGSDGFAVHRFWPRCAISGIVRLNQSVIDMDNSRGMFVHAIQGMRPDSLAARWNFANFQSTAEGGEGVSLVMMEFKTTSAYGDVVVNVGSVVVKDRLIAITAGGTGLADSTVGSSADHLDTVVDAETDYSIPGKISFLWHGHSVMDVEKTIRANLVLDLVAETADTESGSPSAYIAKGLVEKVDVLIQVPYMVKKLLSYAVGTKPFIYTVRSMSSP
jgi:hypothetical protein